MNRRDLAVNGVLFLGILGVVYLLVMYKPAEVEPPDLPSGDRGDSERPVAQETRPGPRVGIDAIAMNSSLSKVNPFRTILTPTPTPTPTPRPPRPFPRLNAVMAQYDLLLLDPPRGTLTLQKKNSTDMLKWRVGETKTLPYRNANLAITLKSIDRTDFSAEFTAKDTEAPDSADQAPFRFRFF